MWKIILLTVFIVSTINTWGFTTQEQEMRAKEAHYVIINEVFLEWREYNVEKIFSSDRQLSKFPTPNSFSGEIDCTYTEEFPIILGREVRSNVYKILTIDEEDTGHLIIIDNGTNLAGKPAVIRFSSISLEKPPVGYETSPRYSTIQFYFIYVP